MINGLVAQLVDVFRDKPGQGCHPHIQSELLEHVLLRRVVQRVPVHIPHTVDLDGLTEGGIGLVPVGFIVPVLIVPQSVDHRVKGVVDLPAVQDIQRLGVQLIADALLVGAGRGDQEVQRLFTGVAGAFGQDIVELAVGLGIAPPNANPDTGYMDSIWELVINKAAINLTIYIKSNVIVLHLRFSIIISLYLKELDSPCFAANCVLSYHLFTQLLSE